VAHDGAACDIVGIGLNVIDTTDDVAPPAPAAPVLAPVGKGLQLEWLPVIAGDLAGYRIYYSSQWFFDKQSTGVHVVKTLEGLSSYVLTGLQSETFVRVSAVDMSGNESDPSDIASAEPQAGAAMSLTVAVSAPSGELNESIIVTASGAYRYDFDVDGDGTYDITSSTSGSAEIDTSSLGIIRAAVRGSSSSGTSFARGGVSVVIAGNSRPAASATASPQSGVAPLIVDFTGFGEDQEDETGSLAYAWDIDGDGIYEPDTNQLVLVNEYTVPGVYGVKFRVTDTDGAWDVDTIPVVVSGVDPENVPPTAELSGTPTGGNAPLLVVFDAGGSSDSDGTIVGYEWDFNGDGLYDSYGTASTASFSYSSAGTFTAEVRVSDNGGAMDSATMVVTPRLGTWSPHTAATGVNVGQHTSLAIVDGKPAISYHDVLHFELNYVRATDAAGENWGEPVVVDDSPLVGRYSSLAVVDGIPAISYHDFDNADLKYVRATDAQGSAWGEPMAIDTADAVGLYTSMAVVEGNPAISYFDETFDDLKFVRATDSTGSAWGLPLRIDNTGDVGRSSSLAIVDGKPAVSYYDSDAGNLKFVRAGEADGSIWFSPVTLDSFGDAGFFSSLAVVNGNPAVAYYNNSFAEIRYIRATDATGINWGTPGKINQTDADGYTSLAVVDGRPAVGYFGTPNDLFFVQASDADGTSWATPVPVDTVGDVGRFTSMTMVQGSPAISYYDETQHNLKFARLN
jgi:PKD repeat protein